MADNLRLLSSRMVKRYPSSSDNEYVVKGGRIVGYITEEDRKWVAYKFIDPPKGSTEPGAEESLGEFPSTLAALAAFA